MVFANKGTAHFALEQDRALLCAVEKHGYGNWESVREEIRTDSRLKFQIPAQGMTVQAVSLAVKTHACSSSIILTVLSSTDCKAHRLSDAPNGKRIRST